MPDAQAASSSTVQSATAWKHRRERGSVFMLRLMTWISLRLGRPAGRLILYLITAYFFLLAGSARRASRQYLRRALGREPGYRDVLRHLFSFASTIHDRIYLINDRFDLFEIAVSGEEAVSAILAQGQGAFLMGGHLGSFEALRAVGRRQPGLRVAMVMYEDNARKINAALAAINPSAQTDIIGLGQIDSMLRVRERLDAGIIVGMLADRSLSSDETVVVPFLGEAAAFPVGPFRMAAMLRRPVLFMSGIYLGGNRYEIHFEPLADFSAASVSAAQRHAAVREAVQRYAEILENQCRAHPYNWFNFFDFWRLPEADAGHDEKR
jgi:predicted LPLAT superfamily acyltransferase